MLMMKLREEVEGGLQFVGLLIMQNKLKPQTRPTMDILNRAKIRHVQSSCEIEGCVTNSKTTRSIMVTGDNPLTACHVARSCHLTQPRSPVFLAEGFRNSHRRWQFHEQLPIVSFVPLTVIDNQTKWVDIDKQKYYQYIEDIIEVN